MRLIKDENLRLVLEMAFHSGCRMGELFTLNEAD
jgi:hypothetical protein